MKIWILCSLLLIGASVCNAQDKPLAVDERGKLIYYEVVDCKGLPKDSLFARADAYFKKAGKRFSSEAVVGDSLFESSAKLIIQKTALVMSRPSGEVRYNFYVEVKPEKYRFWFTDFSFIPYQRDRYGNFVPSTTVGTPLESDPGKLNVSEWQSYQKSTAKETGILAAKFKETMANTIPVQLPVKKAEAISTKKW
ncbi:DUF4468 domain-containing protein [Pedobacter metabolipauper]|uniref:Uncharacterized protein with TBP-like fold DUF4468 n=1 Tax=Pedobacter metabolipauper TaxID=425513 RepID=A0A4R6SRX5_9SPHI|nr:DUF4468 domain-containing protein [Pedobacter metabolipauper]TDQ07353.1 uncharacterized protein with TBP-like fold DUF4468 [Pedobacter metabolipauper]